MERPRVMLWFYARMLLSAVVVSSKAKVHSTGLIIVTRDETNSYTIYQTYKLKYIYHILLIILSASHFYLEGGR